MTTTQTLEDALRARLDAANARAMRSGTERDYGRAAGLKDALRLLLSHQEAH